MTADEEEESSKRPLGFIPDLTPFVPVKSSVPLTEITISELNTDRRAAARAKYEEQVENHRQERSIAEQELAAYEKVNQIV